MSLLSNNPVVEIKLYYQEVKVKYGYDKVCVLKENDAERIINDNKEKQEDYENKLEEYRKNKNLPKEERKDIEEPKEPVINKVNIVRTLWKTLTWADQNQITEQSSFYNEQEGMQDLNVWKYRDLRLKTCLVKWDLKDDDGNEIPLNPETINSLPSDVVIYLLNRYDEIISLGEDERKN